MFYDQAILFRVVHNRGHGLSIRCTPCRGCPNVTIRMINLITTVKSHNKTVPNATSKSNGSHPTKLPAMKSGRGSITDPEVCDGVQGKCEQRPGIRRHTI